MAQIGTEFKLSCVAARNAVNLR